MTADNETISLTRFFFASGTVIILMLALAYALKFIKQRGWVGLLPAAAIGNRRLRHIESLPLDARRRLVIVQCDQRQYLLLLGTTEDKVIDTSLTIPPVPTQANPHDAPNHPLFPSS